MTAEPSISSAPVADTFPAVAVSIAVVVASALPARSMSCPDMVIDVPAVVAPTSTFPVVAVILMAPVVAVTASSVTSPEVEVIPIAPEVAVTASLIDASPTTAVMAADPTEIFWALAAIETELP